MLGSSIIILGRANMVSLNGLFIHKEMLMTRTFFRIGSFSQAR